MNTKVDYLIGVDGGGSGTRVAIALANGNELARGAAGTSALRHGADAAWLAVMTAITNAFSTIGLALPEIAQMAIGLGLSGVHNKQWAAQFAEKDPGFALLRLETDACTTLMGAHKGRAGTIVALGTGSVGEALLEDGSHREVGGWGFPCGDFFFCCHQLFPRLGQIHSIRPIVTQDNRFSPSVQSIVKSE